MNSKIILFTFLYFCSYFVEGCKLKEAGDVGSQMEKARQLSELLHFALAPIRNQQFPDLYNKWLVLFNEQMVQATIVQCDKDVWRAIKVFIRDAYHISELFRDFNVQGNIVKLLMKLNPMTSALLINGAITTNYVFRITKFQTLPTYIGIKDPVNIPNEVQVLFTDTESIVQSAPVIIADTKPFVQNEPVTVADLRPMVQNEPVIITEMRPIVPNEPVLITDMGPIIQHDPTIISDLSPIQHDPLIISNMIPIIQNEPVIISEMTPIVQNKPVLISDMRPVVQTEPAPISDMSPVFQNEPEIIGNIIHSKPVIIAEIKPGCQNQPGIIIVNKRSC